MRLKSLSLRHFRNLGVQDLAFPPEGVAVIGDNAQGKSNLLEAVYYVETLRSFRGAPDRRLVAFGQEVFRVSATLEPDGDAREVVVAAAFERTGRRKKASVDGAEPPRLGDALGHVAAVVFSPSDVELVSGGPTERRRFLDVVLSLSVPGYLRALQDFRRILTRRNALLKEGRPPESVAAWNPGLARSGAAVIAARRRWVAAGCEAFGDYYASVSGGARASMTYRPNVPIETADGSGDVEEAYREALASSRERERGMGATTVGPHRDDVRFVLDEGEDGVDLREYGSGGQRRTAALALRLLEARTIREERGEEPVILLDDVFAELDPGRGERVLDLMEREETGQVLLTAPKESDVRLRPDRLPRWRIRDGRVRA